LEHVVTTNNISDAAKAVVRRNTEEVQGGGNFEVFEELFADDFLDHTFLDHSPQPGREIQFDTVGVMRVRDG
jgi:hypothetical protein